MNNKKTKTITSRQQLIEIGWQALVQKLGFDKANEFLMTFFAGQGDSVKEYRKMWGNKSVNQIHQEILKAKKAGRI